MTALKIGLKIDTFLQGICLLVLLIGILDELFTGDEDLMMVAFIMLGAVQIFSACILSVALEDNKRGRHIMHSLMYFALSPMIFSIGLVLLKINNAWFYFFIGAYWIGVPVFLSLRYFRLTIWDMIKVNSLHRSFWDL